MNISLPLISICLDNAGQPLCIDAADKGYGTCLTGRYCAWDATSYTGTKLSFSACSVGGTSSSLAAIGGLARSTANARTSGTVKAVNSGSVIYSMPANIGVPVNGATLTHLVCYS